MKKKISCILGIVMLAASLSACGEKKEDATTTQEVATETAATDEAATDEVDDITEATTEAAKVEITAPAEGSIRVKGEVYSFSAENGIDNWGDIAGGCVLFGGASNTLYPADGGEPVKVDYDDTVNYPVVFQRSVNTEVSGITIGSGGFYIYTDYVLADGVTSTVTGEELVAKGYMQRNDSTEYYRYVTDAGDVDFKDIEADYEKIVSENSFKGLDYYDVLGEVSSDMVKSEYYMDDVAGAIERMKDMDLDPKKAMMDWLARGKCTKLIVDGQVDYYICQSVFVDPEDGAEVILGFRTKDDYMNKWMDNWGVEKE